MKVVKKSSFKNGSKKKVMTNYMRTKDKLVALSYLFAGILNIIIIGSLLLFFFELPGWNSGKIGAISIITGLGVVFEIISVVSWRKFTHPKKRK